MGIVQQNQWFTSLPEFVLLVCARLLPDFCSKRIQFVPHGLEKAEPRVGDRGITVNPCENKLATLQGRFQVGDR